MATTYVLTGQITGDMKIGTSQKDFIPSKSGIYHLGAILASHVGQTSGSGCFSN